MKLNIITLLAFLFVNSAFSQNTDVLFTVNNTKITNTEFSRVYNKNIDLVQDEKQKDVDEYLKLYVNYKLKLEEAVALGLDKDSKYINELASYRKQLSKKYLTDTKINDKLLHEAYERTLNEVNVNHILVRVDEDASPLDTIKAYNTILEYRTLAKKNGFNNTMKKLHNGKTVYGESLGFFKAFQMVYPFENAAYNTPVGDISKPFRTKFGYHIINVLDKQKSLGEVTVAHIMIANGNKNLTTTPEERIKELYQKIVDGADFSSLAKQFSDDKNSARIGGKLTRFGAGKLSSKEFETSAFSLVNVGDISKPLKTQYGWHIIKLIKKHEVQSFDELKLILEQKIKKDSRSRIVNDKFYANLKDKYNYKETLGAKKEIATVVTKEFFNGKWNKESEKYNEVMATFDNTTITYLEYYNYLNSKSKAYKNQTDISKIINNSLEAYINHRIYSYHNDNLETVYPEFGNIVQEYREGLLLFELMEQEIWGKSKNDTIALQKFYDKNKDKYFWGDRVEAVITTSEDKKTARKVRKLLKKGLSVEALKKKENNVVVSQGDFQMNDKEIPENYIYKKGVSKVFKHNNQYVVLNAIQKIVPTQQEFDEVKGKVINDYQLQLEKDWLVELRAKYKVEINQDVLNKLKETL
ncbi:MAG: peptidylprolyl isomerase [Flavobacteriaceae bacterium]|mgnify:CR=1 FL=1